jgi:hypothetical protein
MASQSLIIQSGNTLEGACKALRAIRDAFESESLYNGGSPYPENLDAWTAIYLRAERVRGEVDKLTTILIGAL